MTALSWRREEGTGMKPTYAARLALAVVGAIALVFVPIESTMSLERSRPPRFVYATGPIEVESAASLAVYAQNTDAVERTLVGRVVSTQLGPSNGAVLLQFPQLAVGPNETAHFDSFNCPINAGACPVAVVFSSITDGWALSARYGKATDRGTIEWIPAGAWHVNKQ